MTLVRWNRLLLAITPTTITIPDLIGHLPQKAVVGVAAGQGLLFAFLIKRW
tara:strand:- start:323 stop:475 length:153 start_codon:yes stop_codon:yes gene_type:complete